MTIPSVEVRAMKPRRTIAAAVGIAVALSLFLGIAIVVLVVRSVRVEPVAQAPDVEPVGKAGQAVDPPETAKPTPTTPAPALERVHIRIKTKPANATLELDGKSIDNPISLDRQKDDGVHTLTAAATGYVTKELGLRFDRDAVLEIKLDKGSGISKAPPPPPASTGGDDTLPDLKPKKKTGSAPLDTDDPWK